MTALGLTIGLFIIFKLCALTPQGVTYEDLVSCLGLLIIAAVVDTLDGAIARVMRLESDFGGLFDSMSDAITFGVVPSVFVLKALALDPHSIECMMLLTASTTYSVAGVLRLVRFSTAYVPPEQKAVFTGLPIPAAAFSVTSLTTLLVSYSRKGALDTASLIWIVVGALFFISYMMISRWRFPSLKAINIKLHSFHFIAILACLTAVFFVLFSNNISIALSVGTWGYVLGSWGLALWRLASGKRALAINDSVENEEEGPQ